VTLALAVVMSALSADVLHGTMTVACTAAGLASAGGAAAANAAPASATAAMPPDNFADDRMGPPF
jgi:hypothetical protein